jgi:hypothetical protein
MGNDDHLAGRDSIARSNFLDERGYTKKTQNLDVNTDLWIQEKHSPGGIGPDLAQLREFIAKLIKDLEQNNKPPNVEQVNKWGADVLREIGDDIARTISMINDERLSARVATTIYLSLLSGWIAGKNTAGSPQDALREFARLAGRASGKRRAAKAAETWEPVALKLSLESRKVDKGWSQDDVATYVLEKWVGKKRPSHETLKKRISRWIKQGKLPEKIR